MISGLIGALMDKNGETTSTSKEIHGSVNASTHRNAKLESGYNCGKPNSIERRRRKKTQLDNKR